MATNEVNARNEKLHFAFVADEVSARTEGHRWTEKVVETGDGAVHRLLAIDGHALTPEQAEAEDDRIRFIVSHPDAFRRAAQAHRDDEARAQQLLTQLPTAFLVTPAGEANGCIVFAFRPDPKFQPSTYEERIAAALVGTVALKLPEDRLCSLQARISHPVEFGFGLLGRIEEGGRFTLERVPVNEGQWKTDRISVHLQGHILLLKSLTREQDVVRTRIHILPRDLTLEEAAILSRP